MAADPVLAAGAVLWRPSPRGPQIALVHRPRYDDWSLPKGKLDPGESLAAAAVREVAEETGAAVRLGRPLGVLSYVAEGKPKQVHYWAAKATGALRPLEHEVDAVEWLEAGVALDRLSYPHDEGIVRALLAGPLDTVPLLLVRHAKAIKRKAFDGDDDALRPLDPRGPGQAQRLAPLLDAYGVARVITSPAVRCTETVTPYAVDRGLPLVVDQAWSEAGHELDPASTVAAAALLLSTGRPTAVCTHRPVLPGALKRLLAGTRLPTPPHLNPADLLVLHLSEQRPIAVERHDSGGPDLD
jgi:8-oxo-dGTP pyrophosphatase MutT (NUDIX family)/phosphohistidine phosphatase SixA